LEFSTQLHQIKQAAQTRQSNSTTKSGNLGENASKKRAAVEGGGSLGCNLLRMESLLWVVFGKG
jgi:hypothetical protein